jgi:HAE1 family hydrophobic/amphiphilic exporter-1/multidrug efflux pump
MSGVVGRLLREFSITVALTILVSVVVSLTLTPMLCSRVLKDEHTTRHTRFYTLLEWGFDALLAGYRAGLDLVLRHQRLTLLSFVATVAATVCLFVVIPKGFFPQQDTGVIYGTTEAAQDISFTDMVDRQLAVTDVVGRDPAIGHWVSTIGGLGTNPPNTGYVRIGLKPRGERDAVGDEIIARLREPLAGVPGVNYFMQVPQDLNFGGRSSRTQYQYTLQAVELDELNVWAARVMAKLRTLPEIQDVATDAQSKSAALRLVIDRDQAARFGIQPQLIDDTLYDAFGQRQVTQFFTQLNSYHVVLEVLPEFQQGTTALDKIYIRSPVTGQPVPLSTFVQCDSTHSSFLSINHQDQFPSVTLSFNLRPGVSLGQAVDAINSATAAMDMPGSLTGSFQGTAKAFQKSLASEPYLILAALVAVYIILGVLYESFIHPLTILSTLPSAGVGALLFLMLFHKDLSLVAVIGILLLIGIVKKNGIMMVDFAISAQRQLGMTPVAAIRQACLLASGRS